MNGFVYFIGPEALLNRPTTDELAVVKIGYTSGSPQLRLTQLQTGSPVPLNVFAHIEGSPELEKAFHSAFAQLARSGEWFWCLFKLRMLLTRIDRESADNTFVPRDELIVAMRETVFAMPDAFPGDDGIGDREMTDPEYLAMHFPEVWK